MTPEDFDREDELHDAAVQREVDEQWHAETLLRQKAEQETSNDNSDSQG